MIQPDPFRRPIPLQSLADETGQWGWNRPPEYADVDDFVDAVEVVMDKGENKNIYNVSTDESYNVLEVTKMICDLMDKDVDDCVEYVDDRPFQDPIYLSNSDKLRNIGWKPKRSLKETMPELIDWYTKNRNFFDNENVNK